MKMIMVLIGGDDYDENEWIRTVKIVKMVFYALFRYTITHCNRTYGEWIFR